MKLSYVTQTKRRCIKQRRQSIRKFRRGPKNRCRLLKTEKRLFERRMYLRLEAKRERIMMLNELLHQSDNEFQLTYTACLIRKCATSRPKK